MGEEAEATRLGLMQEINTMSLDRFKVDVLATRANYEKVRCGSRRSGHVVVTLVYQQLLP